MFLIEIPKLMLKLCCNLSDAYQFKFHPRNVHSAFIFTLLSALFPLHGEIPIFRLFLRTHHHYFLRYKFTSIRQGSRVASPSNPPLLLLLRHPQPIQRWKTSSFRIHFADFFRLILQDDRTWNQFFHQETGNVTFSFHNIQNFWFSSHPLVL